MPTDKKKNGIHDQPLNGNMPEVNLLLPANVPGTDGKIINVIMMATINNIIITFFDTLNLLL